MAYIWYAEINSDKLSDKDACIFTAADTAQGHSDISLKLRNLSLFLVFRYIIRPRFCPALNVNGAETWIFLLFIQISLEWYKIIGRPRRTFEDGIKLEMRVELGMKFLMVSEIGIESVMM
ncbi:hypothetical protein ACOSP7_000564 [Xanthoceras sorbifolium]